jgi:ubiquinone/menaquinone biosynthesis C-methylase UbiE
MPSTTVAAAPSLRRLNWGCGRKGEAGWINSDRQGGADVQLRCDIREGLKLEEASIDYAASVHALQEVPFPDLQPVLRELYRVLKPGGVLRLVLPDADKAIQAYLKRDRSHFLVPDEDAASLGGKFAVHILWYSHSRVIFTFDFVEELLIKAGFSRVAACEPHATASGYAGITELDCRESESLFVEAFK